LPCGTTFQFDLPGPYRPSNTQESACRGNEQMILRTSPAASSAARPVSPLPSLLLSTVRSRAPLRRIASMSANGQAGLAEAANERGGPVCDAADRGIRVVAEFDHAKQ
jgi:hypothetical protein